MPHVDLAESRVFYDTAGDTGTPVLLIMGFGAPGRMWRKQVPALSARHRVAWFDNPGAGETSASRRLPTMRDMAASAVGLADSLGWDRMHVVGVSMGGMIAQEIALGFSDRVRSLSLLVTHAGGTFSALPSARALGLFAKGFLGPKSQRSDAVQRLIFTEEYLQSVDRERITTALDQEIVSSGSRRERIAQISAVMRHRTRSRLGQLAATPTMVVKAGQDALIRPRESDRLHALIPGSRLVEFPGSGHAILLQCAAGLNTALLDHFGQADERADRTCNRVEGRLVSE